MNKSTTLSPSLPDRRSPSYANGYGAAPNAARGNRTNRIERAPGRPNCITTSQTPVDVCAALETIDASGVPLRLRAALQALLEFSRDPLGDVIDEGAESITNTFAALRLARELVSQCEALLRGEVESFDSYLRAKIVDLDTLDLDALCVESAGADE